MSDVDGYVVEGSGENIFIGNFEFEFQNAGITAEFAPGQGDGYFVLRGTEPPSGGGRQPDCPTSR